MNWSSSVANGIGQPVRLTGRPTRGAAQARRAVSISAGIPYSTIKKHARALGYEPKRVVASIAAAKIRHG